MRAETELDRIVGACADPERVEPGFADLGERRRIAEHLRGLARRAHRYLLDEAATEAASLLGAEHPEVLLQMLPRARAPFDLMWIEWPLKAQLAAIGALAHGDCPDAVGVFVERIGPAAYRMTEATHFALRGASHAQLSPVSVVYDLAAPGAAVPGADRRMIAEAFRSSAARRGVVAVGADGRHVQLDGGQVAAEADGMLRSCLLGSVYAAKNGEPMDPEEEAARDRQCRALGAHADWAVTPVAGAPYRAVLADGQQPRRRELAAFALEERITETSGMWRFVLSVLTLLNARDYVADDAAWRAGRSRFVGGKVVPYLEFRRVALKLPRDVVVGRARRLLAEAIPRRRHEVQGHWAVSHVRGDPGCDHAYANETDTRQVCVLCGHKRWWRHAHERGDAALGYVLKDHLLNRR